MSIGMMIANEALRRKFPDASLPKWVSDAADWLSRECVLLYGNGCVMFSPKNAVIILPPVPNLLSTLSMLASDSGESSGCLFTSGSPVCEAPAPLPPLFQLHRDGLCYSDFILIPEDISDILRAARMNSAANYVSNRTSRGKPSQSAMFTCCKAELALELRTMPRASWYAMSPTGRFRIVSVTESPALSVGPAGLSLVVVLVEYKLRSAR